MGAGSCNDIKVFQDKPDGGIPANSLYFVDHLCRVSESYDFYSELIDCDAKCAVGAKIQSIKRYRRHVLLFFYAAVYIENMFT